MAGLLDDFLNSDQTRLGLGLLAAAGPRADGAGFGQRLMEGVGSMDQWKQQKEMAKYRDMQMQNLQSEVDSRKAQLEQQQKMQEWAQKLLGGDSITTPQVGLQSMGGAPGLSIGGVTQTPEAPQDPIASLTPRQLAGLKFMGKDLTDVYKLTRPNLTNVNGTMVDTTDPKNAGRFFADPTKSIGFDPRSNQVSLLPGALDAQTALAAATEKGKAQYDLQTIQPQGQNPQITTRSNIVSNINSNVVSPQTQSARDADRNAILNRELANAQAQYNKAVMNGDQSAAARAQGDIAALSREIGGKNATMGIPLQSDEEKLRATKGVEGDANENVARSKDIKTATKFLGIANKADALLKQGPTQSGIGSMMDSTAGFFGYTPKGAEVAQQLQAIGGWLVSNVPRMEGPQSNFDVANYQVMAGDVANPNLPIARRQAALSTIKSMFEDTINQYSGAKSDSAKAKGTENPSRTVVKTGVYGGKKVVQYSDGTTEYAN